MRNKTLITGLVILMGMGLLAGFYGCNRDTVTQPKAADQPGASGSADDTYEPNGSMSIKTNLGDVEVLSITPVTADHLVRLDLRVYPNAQPPYDRILAAQLLEGDSGKVAYIGSLLGDGSSPLWQLEFRVTNEEANSFQIVIRDPHNTITADHRESDLSIFETYTVNGDISSYTIDKADTEHARELYEAGLVNGRFERSALMQRNPSDKALLSLIEESQEFYFSHEELSKSNADAELAKALLGNHRIVSIIKDNLGGTEDPAVINKWWRKVCAAAGLCTYIACEYFGPNPVCYGCGTVALACAIVDLFGPSWF